jgi:tetrahydromethanopterin S-methyltransferase subunit G
MVENHKLKNVEEHCKKLEERVQFLQQEFQESLADQQTKWQEQFGEQNKRIDQISAQIEALSIQFQTFLANQMTGKDLGSTSKGILQTPARGSLEGDQTYGQEQHRMVHRNGPDNIFGR